MVRREFIRKGVACMAGAGVALVSVPSFAAAVTKKAGLYGSQFSIDVVTGDQDRVLRDLGQFLSENQLSHTAIRVDVHPLAGQHIADAVLVRDMQLINYREVDGSLEEHIRLMADRFDFGRPSDETSLVRFTGGAELVASGPLVANLFAGGLLVGKRKLGPVRRDETLSSTSGSMVVRYEGNGVKVVDATCKHKTCVNAGVVTSAGESLVCIPGQLRVVLSRDGVSRDGMLRDSASHTASSIMKSVHAVTQ